MWPEVELGFLVVGGEFDVFLTFLVFHPEFVVRPGTDDVPCVPIGRNVVGMALSCMTPEIYGRSGLPWTKDSHHFRCLRVRGVDAVFGAGIGFGQSDGTAFAAGTPFVQIKR